MDDIQQMARNTFEMSGLNQHDWGMIELGKLNDPVATPSYSAQTYTQPDFNEVSAMDFASPSHSTSGQISLTSNELEALIKSEVNKALDQMHTQLRERIEHELRAEVHAQIPSLAEKIIKDEIHKLLSEPPV